MFSVICQFTKSAVNYNIDIDYLNGKKAENYSGLTTPEAFKGLTIKLKKAYIKQLLKNYVLHKKKLLSLAKCEHYKPTGQRLASIERAVSFMNYCQELESLPEICRQILTIEKDLVFLMENSHKDGDRLTSILAFCRTHKI